MPYIFIANHHKWVDTFMMIHALQEKDRKEGFRAFMGDRLAKNFFIHWFLKIIYTVGGYIPVKKGSGLDVSFERPIECLKRGQSILIFPEGRTVRRGQRVETKIGASELSIRTGVPIVPILLNTADLNAKKILLEEHPIDIKIGEPFFPKPEDDIMDKVYELKSKETDIRVWTGITFIPLIMKIYGINTFKVWGR